MWLILFILALAYLFYKKDEIFKPIQKFEDKKEEKSEKKEEKINEPTRATKNMNYDTRCTPVIPFPTDTAVASTTFPTSFPFINPSVQPIQYDRCLILGENSK